jgi:hypothetical protein
MDGEFDNFAAGMNAVFLRNGVTACTGNLNLGGHIITNIGQGTAAVPALWFTGDPTTGLYSPGPGEVTILSKGVAQLSVTPTGVAFGGNLTTTGPIVTTELDIDGPKDTYRPLNFKTSGVLRWDIRADNTDEAGSNVGSDFYMDAYDDTGTLIANVLKIIRATAGVFFPAPAGIDVTGPIASHGGLKNTGDLIIDGLTATIRRIVYSTSGLARWEARTSNTAEGGSNAGSNYVIGRYADDGVTYLGDALSINRATGGVAVPGTLTLTGLANLNGGAYTSRIDINGLKTTSRYLVFDTNGVPRWTIQANATDETGSNAGSDFVISSWSDAGSTLSNVLGITRSTGAVNIPGTLTVNTSLTVNGPLVSGAITASGMATFNGGAKVVNGLTVSNGATGTGGLTFDSITCGNALTAQGTLNVAGLATFNGGTSVLTRPPLDNTQNIVNTAYLRNNGVAAGVSVVTSSPAAITMTIANTGHINSLAAGVTSVTLPTALPDSAGTYCLSNTSGADLTLTCPLGSDFGNVLRAGQQVVLVGDGNGYYRCLVSGYIPRASIVQNGYEYSASGKLEQWGTTVAIAPNSAATITFPRPFLGFLNFTFTVNASAGTGGMAYAYPLNPTLTSVQIFNAGAVAVAFQWRALGT